MTGIRWSRIVAGGLVAGAVFIVGGMGAHAAFGEAMQSTMRPMTVEEILARHLGLRLLFGLTTVALYAAIRPRFGPGRGRPCWPGSSSFSWPTFPSSTRSTSRAS